MAAPVYATDLTLIDDADAVANYTALGGGASGLSDETDYWIETPQCVSKAGFTASTKGFILNTGTRTVASGDAIFVWSKQNNRNLMDTQANGGAQVLVGDGTADYDQFYVDGNDSEGSDLAGWRTYAVDPTQTPSNTTGTPTTTNRVGMLWKILGSGSLKGNPNALDVTRHGRELTCTNGDVTNGYATFLGAGAADATNTNRWGIFTPATGAYLFHGAFVMGTTGTAVDFRDSNRNIVVLEDPFVPSTFNEFEIRNASSNVEWTGIQISHLGTTSPSTLTLNVGTFTGENCRFAGCATTTFNTNGTGSCINSQWASSGQIVLNQADISGSSILTSTVAADEGAVYDNRTTSGATSISELDNCTFSIGGNAHHAIRFGANVLHDITLTGIEFTGFSSTADANNSTLRFDGTSGSINVNLVGCTVDGNPATTSNVGVDDAAGITVTLVVDPVTTKVTAIDEDGNAVANARVFLETADNGGGSGFPYQASTTSLTQTGGTATCTTAAAHGLATNDYVVIRGAGDELYNKVAQITVTGASTFTYTVDSGASASAGGTPVVSYVALYGLTATTGIVQASKTWPASQSLTGWARKSTTSPYYRQSSLAIADASGGSDVTALMILDE
ncbi:hypothetical protein [[Eubacterium] cellulosolvens]